jgi:retron-type reverse transcriptase
LSQWLKVLERDNLHKAYKQVRANKGAPGIDNISVEEFPEYARRHWEGINAALLEGTYTPSPPIGHTHGYGSRHTAGDLPGAHPGLRS